MGTITEENLIHRHTAKITSTITTPPPIDDSKSSNEYRLDKEDLQMSTLDRDIAKNVLINGNLTHADELKKLKEIGTKTPILPSEIGTDFSFKREIVWSNAIGFALLHICAIIGCLLPLLNIPDYRTTFYSCFLIFGSGLGVTMGAHRLWSHRSFKATRSLKILLLWLHTLAGQNCLYVWVRDHRQHHKYSDTDADPHNANRGFFFSHVGWLMSKKHPKVLEYGKKIDMSDIEADPWIMFQKRHYKVLYTIFALFLPTAVPIYFWNEKPLVALFIAFFARTVIQLNFTWFVNSAAHLYGTRPFDKTIFPVESMFVALMAAGEGWHNYHHAFPWDYRASELGTPLNLTGWLIDYLAKFGLIYDRKEATHNMVKNRVLRTGDKSHKEYGTDDGRSSFKTLFNIWKHPSNPTYNSIHSPKPKIIHGNGYALIQDELSKNELDDDILSRENENLEKQQLKIDNFVDQRNIKKFIVEKSEACKLINHIAISNESKPTALVECNNNILSNNIIKSHSSSISSSINLSDRPRNKSELNISVGEHLLVKL